MGAVRRMAPTAGRRAPRKYLLGGGGRGWTLRRLRPRSEVRARAARVATTAPRFDYATASGCSQGHSQPRRAIASKFYVATRERPALYTPAAVQGVEVAAGRACGGFPSRVPAAALNGSPGSCE
jgi:hypothetical protein